jgi:hypothetical protein
MQQLHAVQRLNADTVEAQFDSEKEHELRRIQAQLRKHALVFSYGNHYLYHKSNDGDIAREGEQTADVLNRMGYQLSIRPGAHDRPSYALRGRDGIILQKVNSALRIFFSI